jgi:hypothetical protein
MSMQLFISVAALVQSIGIYINQFGMCKLLISNVRYYVFISISSAHSVQIQYCYLKLQ